MQNRVDDQTVLRAPATVVERAGTAFVALDPASPNWIATDDRGLRILRQMDGRTPLGEIIRAYAAETGLDLARAWLHVDTFARDGLRQKFLSTDGRSPVPYPGRAAYLRTDRLREFWIQVNDFCNLACEHCLVSSGPQGGHGLPGAVLRDVIDQAVALGTERFFLTGGEPLARADVPDLIGHIVEAHERELVILTNGTLLKGERLRALARLPSERLRVQISLDGASAELNDPIRGEGTFDRIVDGIRAAVDAGLRTTLTMVLLRHNLAGAPAMVELAARLGVPNLHLLWPHRRGRVLTGPLADLPAALEILESVRTAREIAHGCGVTIDNVEELRLRFDGLPGIKNDLAGAGWTSLCLYTDAGIYPSPAMAGVPDLHCGSILEGSLETVWKESPILRELRATSVEQKSQCRSCHLKFLCGGGDFEHGYWASGAVTGRGDFAGHDPYCELYKGLARDVFERVVEEGRSTLQPRSGYDRPVVLRGMGERTLHDESLSLPPEGGSHQMEHSALPPEGGSHQMEHSALPPQGGSHATAEPEGGSHATAPEGGSHATEHSALPPQGGSHATEHSWLPPSGGRSPVIVRTTHSACVLSEEVADRSRAEVRAFYGHAAEQPQAGLCCPIRPDPEDLAHIPAEVVERFYGCGSPVSAALPQPGETLVDLGSGAGIDCFIASKRVGSEGRVFGVDMTDQMLGVARECQPAVAMSLGYDNVEFRNGLLEQIPLEDARADIVTSNCVINLSPDKPAVFREIWRVLRDHGRAVIADIVADGEVPPPIRADGQLWGECISGALSEEAFLAAFERAGFYGVSILKKTFWREVEGTRFHSITVRGFKFEKKAGCRYVGQYAIYLGPMKAALDEEGHMFPRGVAVEVCTDTAARLRALPYSSNFAVTDGPGSRADITTGDCCGADGGCC